jgi:hypothetical protein
MMLPPAPAATTPSAHPSTSQTTSSATPVGWAVFMLFQICFVGTVAVHAVEAARPGMRLFAGGNIALCFVPVVYFSTGFPIYWLPCLWVSCALQAPSGSSQSPSASTKTPPSRRPVHMAASEAACVGCGMLALAVMSALQLLDTPRSWTIYTPAGMLLTGARGLFVHVPPCGAAWQAHGRQQGTTEVTPPAAACPAAAARPQPPCCARWRWCWQPGTWA